MQYPNTITGNAQPRRPDRVGEIFASGVLKAVPNGTERRVLFANAIKSGSDIRSPNYRKHWHSDASIARLIGSDRQTVNHRQNSLQVKGIISRIETPYRRTRITELAEYAPLANIAEDHGGTVIDIRPAPRPTGPDWPHLIDELFESGILKYLPGIAGELAVLYYWLASPDPDAPDFGQYSITDEKAAAVLYRSPRRVRDARKILISAKLIARDGKTITLQAHTAAEIAERRPPEPSQTRPFTEKAKDRCQTARQKPDTVTTHKAKPDAVMTHNRTRSRQVAGRGHDTTPDAVTTRTTIEQQQRTINENHRGASENGQFDSSKKNRSVNSSASFNDHQKMIRLNDELIQLRASSARPDYEREEEIQNELRALQTKTTAPEPETTTSDAQLREAAGEAKADAGQVEACPTTSAPIWEPPNDTCKERHQYLKDGRRGKRALRTKETAGNSAPDPHLVDPDMKFKLEEMMKSLPEAEQDHIIQELTKEFDVIEDAIKAGEITSAQAKLRRTLALEAQINALNQQNRTGATDTLKEEPASYLVPEPAAEVAARPTEMVSEFLDSEQNQQSDTSLLHRGKDAEIPYRKAQIEHIHQRRLRRPQSSKKRFIPAKQVPAITTEKIPFASIAAVWDEPWMADAVTEFTRRMQPWLDLDTGDEPLRVEAAYNPDRPHDTPHIINMKHAYALQQRISAEQRAGAGLTDPLAPLIEAHQARPAGVN